jgi:hypothetical protein
VIAVSGVVWVNTGALQYVKGVVLGGKLQGGGQRTDDRRRMTDKEEISNAEQGMSNNEV